MHFNFACVSACVFAVAALAVPVEVERKVVVVRDVCPAPTPAEVAPVQTAAPAPAPAPEASYAPPPPHEVSPPPHEISPPPHEVSPAPHEASPAPAPAPAREVSSVPVPEVSSAPEYHPPPPSSTTTVSNPPAPQTTSSSADNKQCSSGSTVHCCDTVDSTDNSDVLNQLTAAGIDHQTAQQKGQVGLTCTPITTSLVDALNGNVCQGSVTACCDNTTQYGLINLNLGCTIIPVNL